MHISIFLVTCAANICLVAASNWGCFGINDEFQCGDGRCVHQHWTCDGESDCDNGKDEENCGVPDTVSSLSDVVSLVLGHRCREGYFKCPGGACIRNTWLCDGDLDCDDGSDESNCGAGCTSQQFECNDGSCINAQYTCDWEEDCTDGSDELECNSTCSDIQFQCGSGRCISANWKCDGQSDCNDGSDEAYCGIDQLVCPDNKFSCDDGLCINRSWKCDGDVDCDDGSDEANCRIEGVIDSIGSATDRDNASISVLFPPDNGNCDAIEFSCDGGQLCIRRTWLCDGDIDCEDQSDEENCATTAAPSTEAPLRRCRDNQFQCSDGEKCIRQNWKCDGEKDCVDGSDEVDCGVTEVIDITTTCSPGEFRCDDGSCLLLSSWECDGEIDCADGSDEAQCGNTNTISVTESSTGCSPGEFQCNDGIYCIKESWKCDGESDCIDKSDELGCDTSTVVKPDSELPMCSYVKFRCANGRCMKGSWECDGEDDCGDNSDEAHCSGIGVASCKPSEFECSLGKCIDKTWKCDGEFDCEDKSDEANCNITAVKKCHMNEFQCGDGSCVEQEAICDRQNDCPDKSDEAQCECGKRPMLTRTRFRRGVKFEKIVDGSKADFGEFPWQASLRTKTYWGDDSKHGCGAVLINSNWVLTAAHCIEGEVLSDVSVRLGEHDFSHNQESHPHIEMSAKRIIMHPKYNSDTYDYDFALVQLPREVKFQPNIQPICLPGTNDRLTDYDGWISGWGTLQEGKSYTAPNDLRKARIPIITNARCSSLFRAAGRDELINDAMLCAGFTNGGPDTCQGDSGGPLQIRTGKGRWVLAGIVSWGIGCGGDLPGVYTRVSKFVPWILKHISGN